MEERRFERREKRAELIWLPARVVVFLVATGLFYASSSDGGG
jgi:hypothetical protein